MNARGEPVYGPRDVVDLERVKRLGKPFWLAGTYGHPEKLQEALHLGAAGIQVGTAFAFCEESGFTPEIKRQVLQKVIEGTVDVYTDPAASPTGFPFKVVDLHNSLSDEHIYSDRPRVCDLGYLRILYKKADGSIGYRCPAEPADLYAKKGGRREETMGRKCLCNGLQSVIGLGQVANSYTEPPLITAGDDLKTLTHFLKGGKRSYTAKDVILYLQGVMPNPL